MAYLYLKWPTYDIHTSLFSLPCKCHRCTTSCHVTSRHITSRYITKCYVMSCNVTVCYAMLCHIMLYIYIMFWYVVCKSCHIMLLNFWILSYMTITLCFIVLRHVIMEKLFHESTSIPTLPLPIYSDAADGNYLGWQGKQVWTWSPLICPVEALIPLPCEGAGTPGRSSSLPTAWRQSSLSAFEVGVDLEKPGLVSWRRDSSRSSSSHKLTVISM